MLPPDQSESSDDMALPNPNASSDEMMIAGKIGTYQHVSISGGKVQGPIIGSQTNHYGAQKPTPTDPPVPIVSKENIDLQRELLEAHRRTLAIYLKQQALLGGSAYVPPGVANGIDEARAGIRQSKAALRGWGVVIEDHPDDQAIVT